MLEMKSGIYYILGGEQVPRLKLQLSRCTGCIQESWWRQAVPGAVQRGFRKEVKRKNSQYRKVRKISEEGLRAVLEEFEKQGVERKTFQLWGVVSAKGPEERSCELAGPALDLRLTQWRRPSGS